MKPLTVAVRQQFSGSFCKTVVLTTHPSEFGPVSSGRREDVDRYLLPMKFQPGLDGALLLAFPLCCLRRSILMNRILNIVGWVAVAVLGLVLWSAFPEVRTIIACLLAATLIFHVFFAAVKLAAGRIVGDRLTELHFEINAIAERLEHMDRKANALLMNAVAERQAASLREAARVAPRQTLAMRRRSA